MIPLHTIVAAYGFFVHNNVMEGEKGKRKTNFQENTLFT